MNERNFSQITNLLSCISRNIFQLLALVVKLVHQILMLVLTEQSAALRANDVFQKETQRLAMAISLFHTKSDMRFQSKMKVGTLLDGTLAY